jgi:hypothetical protein
VVSLGCRGQDLFVLLRSIDQADEGGLQGPTNFAPHPRHYYSVGTSCSECQFLCRGVRLRPSPTSLLDPLKSPCPFLNTLSADSLAIIGVSVYEIQYSTVSSVRVSVS